MKLVKNVHVAGTSENEPANFEAGKTTAIIFVHGTGAQAPFEGIDHIARGLYQEQYLLRGRSPKITTRLAPCKVCPEVSILPRAELLLKSDRTKRYVHVYEGYWAPLTEGKIKVGQVIAFIFDSCIRALRTGTATAFWRWSFHHWRSYEVRFWDLAGFGLAGLIFVGLVVINVTVATVMLAYTSIGSSSWANNSFLVDLTADLSIVTFPACIVFLSLWLSRFIDDSLREVEFAEQVQFESQKRQRALAESTSGAGNQSTGQASGEKATAKVSLVLGEVEEGENASVDASATDALLGNGAVNDELVGNSSSSPDFAAETVKKPTVDSASSNQISGGWNGARPSSSEINSAQCDTAGLSSDEKDNGDASDRSDAIRYSYSWQVWRSCKRLMWFINHILVSLTCLALGFAAFFCARHAIYHKALSKSMWSIGWCEKHLLHYDVDFLSYLAILAIAGLGFLAFWICHYVWAKKKAVPEAESESEADSRMSPDELKRFFGLSAANFRDSSALFLIIVGAIGLAGMFAAGPLPFCLGQFFRVSGLSEYHLSPPQQVNSKAIVYPKDQTHQASTDQGQAKPTAVGSTVAPKKTAGIEDYSVLPENAVTALIVAAFITIYLIVIAREILTQIIGDIAIYLSANGLGEFRKTRLDIQDTIFNVMKSVYGQRDAAGNLLYDRVIVIGHSLGSIIAYDVLNRLINLEIIEEQELAVRKRTIMFLSTGSPLDKSAWIFQSQKLRTVTVREALGSAVQPLILRYKNRPPYWINVYSNEDPVSESVAATAPLK